jgi:6-phosphogluconolactonase
VTRPPRKTCKTDFSIPDAMIARALAVFSAVLTLPLLAVPVFIGTNTGSGESKGIYVAGFDPNTGKLSVPALAAEYGNPGFLAQHPTEPVLYAVGQPSEPFADGTGAVAAFSIALDQSLTLLGEVSSGGRGPTHLAVDLLGRTVAVANYGDGRISTVRLDRKGVPTELVSVITNKGDGPNKRRQDGPHAHGVYFDRANRYLFVPDLGLDRVLIYRFDGERSALTDPVPALSTAPGAGPRHLAFSPDERHAYVINELDNTVLVAGHKPGSGELRSIAVAPTLPEGFEGNNTTAEVEVHPNGRFVYGSNRGHDSIVVYQRDPDTGNLTLLQHAPAGGSTPRHFKIDPSGRWLLCAHQDSNTISVLSLDPETGLLGEPANTVPCPRPICIHFMR